jgi:phospholipid-binding lipoprotein MlaA
MPSFRVLGFALCVLSFFLTGCASTRVGQEGEARQASGIETHDANDPFEGFNRAMYAFNDTVDRYALKPVAQGYRAVTPAPVRRGVANFFSNLREPIVMLNNALQGKFGQAASDLGRFLTNSTVGVLGLFDVAQHFGMERHVEDFGQTLGAWGVSEGPYLVLPFFGPSTLRDGVGLYADYWAYPPSYLADEEAKWALYVLEVVDYRSRLLEAGDILQQAAGEDPYIFVREAFRQRRRGLVYDGAPPDPPVDPSIFEDDVPAPKTPKPATPPADAR